MTRHIRYTQMLLLSTIFSATGSLVVDGAEPPREESSRSAVTVRDFGAAGDGHTDDTSALQNAVDAGVGDLQLPKGEYRISKPIVINLQKTGFVSFSGCGTARIVMAGSGPALKFVGSHRVTADPKTVEPDVWQNQRMPTVDGIEIVGAHSQAVGIEASGPTRLHQLRRPYWRVTACSGE